MHLCLSLKKYLLLNSIPHKMPQTCSYRTVEFAYKREYQYLVALIIDYNRPNFCRTTTLYSCINSIFIEKLNQNFPQIFICLLQNTNGLFTNSLMKLTTKGI